MSALSTPGGGGTTAQSKPTSGKQKYQKLDINSLYCANRNENSEPSSVKSQLSRKHGMQSLGKVPSARRPPANLPSLKTETGQDPNSNSISTTATTVSTPATCSSQTITTSSSGGVVAGTGPGGWVPLPPPSSPHFRTEFPSLEASAQPSHRSSEHSAPQPQLRPQTEGSWTCGGGSAARADPAGPPAAAAPASTPAAQQTPAFRAILPSFLMKGSTGGGLGLGTLGSLRDTRGGPAGPGAAARPAPRAHPAPAAPRAVEVLTARPILREEQISSLDDISRDAGWAQHDDIDYDQKLDFSDGESSAPNKGSSKNNNRTNIEHERVNVKIQEPDDEEQLWAERRQKQSNQVAEAIARARLRKEEEQRRQMRDTPASQSSKDSRDRMDRGERDRNDNRDRDADSRDKDRIENRERERPDNRDRDRMDNRDKERNDLRDRDMRDKERVDNRDRIDNRDRYDNRDNRDRDRDRDRLDNRDRGRNDNRDRQESDKDRMDVRDRDRNDNRERMGDRFDRERERPDNRDRDRDRVDRERVDRDRDRDFRDRDRDYGRERDQSNPAFSKTFQANIPPRFLKQQQNRQQEEQHKAWAFTGKQAPRRQEPPPYNAPRHAPHNGGRRSYSRDYSDREDDFRRDKEGSGPQWRSEMQEYDRPGREFDRSNSKDSYKDYSDYNKDRRNDSDRKSSDSTVEHTSSRTAADKLTEVFERKSIGLTEPFASSDSSIQTQTVERRNSPPSSLSQRESSEKDFSKASWAEASQDESTNYTILKSSLEKVAASKDNDQNIKDSTQKSELENDESKRLSQQTPAQTIQQITTTSDSVSTLLPSQNQAHKTGQSFILNQQVSQSNSYANISSQAILPSSQSQSSFSDTQSISKTINQPLSKQITQTEILSVNQIQKQSSSEHMLQNISKPMFSSQKSEKELSESESIASKSSTDPSGLMANKVNESHSMESLQVIADSHKRSSEEKRLEKFGNEQLNRITGKEPIERKSSGSGSEKKGRGYAAGGSGYVYSRGWGSRESRGRRSHRSSRSNRASESDGSTDGAPNAERKERRRAPRSPRGNKKQDRSEDANRPLDHGLPVTDGMENREPFAPRGQPSRRGRGGFHGTSRPPAPAKRVTGYGPPNTKSPFSQTNRAAKENDEGKDNLPGDEKGKANKPRTGSSTGRGRDRRPKGAGVPHSGEDENWETTSEHSEGGGSGGRRRSVGGRQSGQSQKGPGGRNQNSGNRQNSGRTSQGAKKDTPGDNKSTDITEAMTDLKLSTGKKDDEVIDDGFQEVRNKKNSKDARVLSKEESQHTQKQPRSHSNQGGGRNGSSTRNSSDKPNSRGAAPVSGKAGLQYDRPRQANLAPRFVKQRQKQQMGLVTGFGPDTGAAPPPPPVNAWDKPISQTLRGSVEEHVEVPEIKSGQSSQRSTPGDAPTETKVPPATCALATDKAGVLDGTTPPVETIIFENTNYKTAPPAEALKQKYQPGANTAKSPGEEIPPEMEARSLSFNGDVRPRPRSIQELIGDNGRPVTDAEGSLGLQMAFDTSQKAEDSSDMKLDFAFDSDLGQLTEDKSAKALGLPRGTHMSTSNTISPLAADLNLKIASVKKVWEMPAVVEGSEELQFAGFEESNTETGAPPNVCKVKPTQQLQSPPPQHYNHVGYQGGYGGLSVPSPPAVLFNSSQQLLGSSQQMQQQGSLYGAFLEQSRGQFGGFPGSPYGAGSGAPFNYQPPPDMFQSLPSQYRMVNYDLQYQAAAAAAAGGGAAFGQSGQLGNSPSTVLISSSSNSLMSATVKPTNQQIGAIGSKGGGVGGVGGVNTYQQQYLGYSGPVGESPYSLQGLLPRPAPPASSYYSPYQPPAAPAPTYPLQFTPPAQSGAFGSQFLSSQLQVAAAVQQMQQQYRAPMQQQYAPPQPRPPPQQQLKSPLHEHANGFAPRCETGSPTPKGAPKQHKPPHSPPQHKYHAPPPTHQHHHQQHQQQQQMVGGGNGGRCGGGGGGGGAMGRGGMGAPRYPAPIQRPHAPALPMYRAPPGPAPGQAPPRHHHAPPRQNMYYHHHQRNGAGGPERASPGEAPARADEPPEPPAAADAPPAAEVPAE